MSRKLRNLERGQAVVLLAIGFVVLLGFTALAIDGSMIYSDRRYAQNAADAASLAGGGEAALYLENQHVTATNWTNCSITDVLDAMSLAQTKAIARAGDNDFIIDAAVDHANGDYNGVTAVCGAENTVFGPKPYIDVIVEITMQTNTAFAHFVYDGPWQNRVKSVTRVYLRTSFAFGNAIVALNTDTCLGQQHGAGFHGTSDVYVFGGGVFSNGCLRGDGDQLVDVDGGGVYYVAEWNGSGDFLPDPPGPQQAPSIIPPEEYLVDPPPDCSKGTTWGASAFPNYLQPGLHCVVPDTKSQVKINNGLWEGYNVTIVLDGVDLEITGGEVKWTAPSPDPNPDPAIAGLLLYMPTANLIKINGNNDSLYEGTILAPLGDIELEGGTGIDCFYSQVIGLNVEAGGVSGLNVHFDNARNVQQPTKINLYE